MALVENEDALHDVNAVKNKHKRNELVKKIKKKRRAAKKVEKEKRQKLLKEQGLPLPKPQTIDSQRTHDETFVADNDPEVLEDERTDEFAELLGGSDPPSLLMTTCPKPSKATHDFVKELECVFPFSTYKKRKETTLVTQVVEYAKQQGHTAVMIVNEDVKQVNALTLIHLPHGPTLSFKVSSLRLSQQIFGHGKALRDNFPELVMNNFRTRLGRRISRSLQSLFHTKPMCHNRQVATFHNQRDFLFFRHHRYIFEKRKEKVKTGGDEGGAKTQTKIQTRLQELGPRFTLKLQTIQKGILNWKYGDFEWCNTQDNKDSAGYNRRTYVL
ncbi:Brix domain-containing protein [Chloropicon primus]|uniref:Brix domain-containing protein n=1 Tax=Chloropicon primus TaxID=1764295 RepID=A0A5B8MWP7_9CHLO|nr:Brix domain-containing protein [Chloropicon primus]UPR04198.1 Brix domain-containing protein [Chloropicon primus]|eukprot:QDZ24989.1 Brix domain-containing protein [Chloropicon primus]